MWKNIENQNCLDIHSNAIHTLTKVPLEKRPPHFSLKQTLIEVYFHISSVYIACTFRLLNKWVTKTQKKLGKLSEYQNNSDKRGPNRNS